MNNSGCGGCPHPEKCIHLRSIRQEEIHRAANQAAGSGLCQLSSNAHQGKDNNMKESATGKCGKPKCPAQVLYRGANFQPHRSDEDIFYDCQSFGDNESSKGTNKYDDAEIVCNTVQRAAQAAHMIMQNFDQGQCGCQKPCTATLEITARLIPNPKNSNPNCRLQGRPVTVQMPLEFDPQTGHMATKSARSLESKPTGKHAGEQQSVDTIGDAVGPTVGPTVGDAVGDAVGDTVGDTVGERVEEIVEEPLADSGSFVNRTRSVSLMLPPSSDEELKKGWSPDKRQSMEEPEVIVEKKTLDMPIVNEGRGPPVVKRYFLALPQHKEFSNCCPCRFSPSPIMDEEGNVFCPGNCGCCQCAWKVRSFDKNDEHVNVKVCRCVQRGTIFTSFDERENCSQTSYFDFCPCREKAEAKFLQLYHYEMWSTPDATRGREISLDEIVEITDFDMEN